MPPAAFLRSDEPPVLRAGVGAHPCSTCEYWSRWLPETGDCMLYAALRREAMIAVDNMEAFLAATPAKSARVTSADECCTGWTARQGRGLSR